MTKDEMARLACVTARADGMYSIYATVSPKKGLAAKISKILASESERTGESVAAVIRRAVLNLRNFDEVTEQLAEAQTHNAHAQEILQESPVDPEDNLSLWAKDDLIVLVNELARLHRNAEMVLRGCPIINKVEPVSEDSAKYRAWAREQEIAATFTAAMGPSGK